APGRTSATAHISRAKTAVTFTLPPSVLVAIFRKGKTPERIELDPQPDPRYTRALFPRVFDVGKLVELDVIENAVDLLDAADVNRLHDVARVGIDHDRAARAHELHALDRTHETIRIDRAARFLQRLGNGRHPVVTGAGHEVGAQLRAVGLGIRLEERLVLRRIVRRRIVEAGDQPQRRLAHRLQHAIVGEIARGDDLDTGLLESALLVT